VTAAFGLVGLAAVAVTQPVLDLMGRNPQFFVAGAYTGAQIVAFALVVALVPPLVLVAVYAAAWRMHPRVGEVVHAVLAAALGVVLGNVVLRGFGGDGALAAIGVGLAGAVLALWLRTERWGRLLLSYLAGAQVLFLVAFLAASPATPLITGTVDPDALGEVTVPMPPGPVVVVVFDELPLPTLLRADGTINGDRYPSFARLADRSTWFRNASTPHSHTELAVPAIVTGNVLEEGTLPSHLDLPRNLLALLSTRVPVERLEPVTDLCPPNVCDARDGQPLTQALEDSAVVYGHRVLPEPLRDDLPRIDEAWGSFGGEVEAEGSEPVDPLQRWHDTGDAEKAGAVQAELLVEKALEIDASPRLHFLHAVTPHVPWHATPWGTTLLGPMPHWREDPDDPLSRWSALIRYQRHSLQTGAADVALGRVLDHLDDEGLWDRTTLLVIADHGTGTIWPDVRREVTPRNQHEVLRVPMFLKVPGQERPVVDDQVASTVDALPTLIDVLDIEVDWDLDGHSLLDGSRRTVEPRVGTDIDGLLRAARQHAADFPMGDTWTDLAAVGEHAALVGRPVADIPSGSPSELTWTPAQEASFRSLPTRRGQVPQILTGVIDTVDGRPPPPLVVAVNGTIAGVTGGYEPTRGGWAFSAMLGPFFVDGANEVQAYAVGRDGGGPVLHLVR
jgi:hypothetical protein